MIRGRKTRLRASILLLSGVITLAFLLVPSTGSARPTRTPDTIGEWAAPFDLGVVPVHATLLHTGTVLLYADPDEHIGSEAHVWDPATGSNIDIGLQYARNLFCSGQAVLPGGKVLVAGGTEYGSPKTGTRLTTVLDPATETWSEGPLMKDPRWYATPVELGNGRMLVFAGQADKKHPQRTVDALTKGSFHLLPRSANRMLGNFPALHLLPNGKIFYSAEESNGPAQHPAVFDPAKNTWRDVDQLIEGPRYQAPSVLLPGLHEVLVAGGTDSPGGGLGGAKNSAEIFDFGDPMMPQWHLTGSMEFARRNLNAVLLADGTVLAVGGNQTGFYGDPVLDAELFDPKTETWSTMAAQQAPRGHHSVAVLLPDGRVLSAGQTDGSLGNTGEIYSPPYLFKGPRPTITAVASSVKYGKALPIQSPDAEHISRVALVRPGSVTHADDFDQRYVDLEFSESAGVVNATSPANGNIAPPGWYMLFVVNDDGVPSVASWVHVG